MLLLVTVMILAMALESNNRWKYVQLISINSAALWQTWYMVQERMTHFPPRGSCGVAREVVQLSRKLTYIHSHESCRLHVRLVGRIASRGGSWCEVMSYGKVKALKGPTWSEVRRLPMESTTCISYLWKVLPKPMLVSKVSKFSLNTNDKDDFQSQVKLTAFQGRSEGCWPLRPCCGCCTLQRS